MDEIERKELVSRIERGEYVTYEKPSYSSAKLVTLALVLAMIAPALYVAKLIVGKAMSSGWLVDGLSFAWDHYLYAAIVVFLLVLTISLVAHSRKLARIYDLSKLTAAQKNLILKGDIIEADYVSITDSIKGSVLKCRANIDGRGLEFESPAIRASFLPIGGGKVSVFINRSNPNEYLVNIYNHIPQKGPKVLPDKDQLRYEGRSEEDHWRRIVLGIVFAVLFILFWPIALAVVLILLSPLLMIFNALRSANTPALVISCVLALIAFAFVWGIYRQLQKLGAFQKGSRMSKPTNYYLPVRVNRYWTTEYIVREDGKKKTYRVHHISARYSVPETNYVYDFTTTGPSMISRLDGKEVHVFVNPENMNKYCIDYISALKDSGQEYSNKGFSFDQYGVWYEK